MSWLEQQWYRRPSWSAFLLPLSWLFACIILLRHKAYQIGLFPSQRLGAPVIVVGNINVGGTGKTPFVLWLATQLRNHGYQPGIISRGYGGDHTLPQQVTADSDVAIVGDEALLLARRGLYPVWVGRNRAATGAALLAAHPGCTVIISDDGLQHYRLQRDMEIVVIDGQRGFGNTWLLPAGPLREPISRLHQVDMVVVNSGEFSHFHHPNTYAMQLTGDVLSNLVNPAHTASTNEFSGQNLHAVAGIGNPQRFFDQLHKLGLKTHNHAFPDHHPYQPDDLNFTGADAVFMTAKDAVKCAAFAQPHWWALEVSAELPSSLIEAILSKLRKS